MWYPHYIAYSSWPINSYEVYNWVTETLGKFKQATMFLMILIVSDVLDYSHCFHLGSKVLSRGFLVLTLAWGPLLSPTVRIKSFPSLDHGINFVISFVTTLGLNFISQHLSVHDSPKTVMMKWVSFFLTLEWCTDTFNRQNNSYGLPIISFFSNCPCH